MSKVPFCCSGSLILGLRLCVVQTNLVHFLLSVSSVEIVKHEKRSSAGNLDKPLSGKSATKKVH